MANLTASLPLNMELNGNALLVTAETLVPATTFDGWISGRFESQSVSWIHAAGAPSIYTVDKFQRFNGSDSNHTSLIFSMDGFSISVQHISDLYNTYDTDAEVSYALMQEILFGNDNIKGSAGNDRLYGFTGNDVIDGGSGADLLVGGSGNDTYVYTAGDTITEGVGAGTDTIKTDVTLTLTGNIENLTLTGSAAINGTGNTLNNVITGNSGNNLLDGSTGSDTLAGGAGNDRYVFNGGDTISEASGAGTDTVNASTNYTLANNLENLTLTGTAISGIGNSLNNVITGNSSNNSLSGLDGNDTLNGGSGKDTLAGGKGNDLYILKDADTINEASGAGTDTVQSSISHTLRANVENLTLTGSSAINGMGNDLKNTITGNSGNNKLDGGTGTAVDTLAGGGGADTYIYRNGDIIKEASGAGTDTVQSGFSYTLTSNVEQLVLSGSNDLEGTGNTLANTITGNTGDNALRGDDGNDMLQGDEGNDTLIGGDGNDILVGGVGNDILSGGPGDDTYRFNTGLNAATNVDTITFFMSGEDSIQLSRTVFSHLSSPGTLHANNFSTAGTALDGNDFIVYNSVTGQLFYDADGSGAGAQIQFALVGTAAHPLLSAADFSVV